MYEHIDVAPGEEFDDVHIRFLSALDNTGKVICPCCDQKAGIYKAHINFRMVHSMRFLRRRAGEYVHLPSEGDRIILTGNNTPKLMHWGLVENLTNEDETKASSGYYRITQKGLDFVRGQITVPEHVIMYNNCVLGYSERHVHWWEVKPRFDIRETHV